MTCDEKRQEFQRPRKPDGRDDVCAYTHGWHVGFEAGIQAERQRLLARLHAYKSWVCTPHSARLIDSSARLIDSIGAWLAKGEDEQD